jgi:uncharacterized protein YjbI with pentapeptide repeats
MADFTRQDLAGSRFEQVDLTGARFRPAHVPSAPLIPGTARPATVFQ